MCSMMLTVPFAILMSIMVTVTATTLHPMEEGTYRGVPQPWKHVQRAHSHAPIELTFALRHENTEELETLLLRVSDPRDVEYYGKHLTLQQVADLIGPSDMAITSVLKFLSEYETYQPPHHRLHTRDSHHVWEHGVNMSSIIQSPSSDFITVVVTAATAEAMLNTEYHVYESEPAVTNVLDTLPRKPMQVIRSTAYHLPSTIAPYISFVSPTIRFPVIQRQRIRFSPNDLFNTPATLRSLYQAGQTQGNSTKNIQAVASFLEQYYSPDDLQEFFALYQNFSVGQKVARDVGINGGGNFPNTSLGTEAELDVEYLMAMGAGVTTWVYQTGGRNPHNPANEPFLSWLVNVSSEATIPSLFSVSYGEPEHTISLDYANSVNTQFKALGARGVSILFASGDSGAGDQCTSSSLSPDFPAGSPWVTTVGGLTGGTDGATPTGEAADFISGGGFSNFFAQPSYQSQAVAQFLANKTGLPDFSLFNQSGRGYPDVAAQSEGFVVVQRGLPIPGVGGTSCATPTFSGIISLLNDLRFQAGKSSLGFLNPLIYQTASSVTNSFNDAVTGFNEGCGGITGAFPARTGWDAASGWGSPNYAILSKVVQQLP